MTAGHQVAYPCFSLLNIMFKEFLMYKYIQYISNEGFNLDVSLLMINCKSWVMSDVYNIIYDFSYW